MRKAQQKAYFTISIIILVAISSQVCSAAHNITPDTLSKWVTSGTDFDFILIDVRDSSQTELLSTGVIGTPDCHPYNFSYNRGVFDLLMPQIPKQTAIVLYCKSGGRSGNAAAKLDASGFSSVYTLQGGFNNWKGSVDSISHIKPATDLPKVSRLKFATNSLYFQKRMTEQLLISIKENRVFVNRTIPTQHTLQIFNMTGKCMLFKSNLFVQKNNFLVPENILPGMYIANLRNHQQPLISFKFIVTH